MIDVQDNRLDLLRSRARPIARCGRPSTVGWPAQNHPPRDQADLGASSVAPDIGLLIIASALDRHFGDTRRGL